MADIVRPGRRCRKGDDDDDYGCRGRGVEFCWAVLIIMKTATP